MSSKNRFLHVLPLCKKAEELYRNHGTFHEGDAGLDLFLIENQTIKAGETTLIKLGIKCTAYDGDVNVSWLIMPRSSISKTPIRISNSLGLIDSGYRGELMCCVDNIKNYDYEVKAGDRIVQAVFFDGRSFSLKIVESLSETSRGEGGWGSTSQNDAPLDSAEKNVAIDEKKVDEKIEKKVDEKKVDEKIDEKKVDEKIEKKVDEKIENVVEKDENKIPGQEKKRFSSDELEGEQKKVRTEKTKA